MCRRERSLLGSAVAATMPRASPISIIAFAPGQCTPAGANASGQLGTNSTTVSNVPVEVLGSAALNFTLVQAAQYFSCGLQANGSAWCWGDNSHGNLGTGDTTPSLVPVMVIGGFAFTQISATHYSYAPCAVTATGNVYCW